MYYTSMYITFQYSHDILAIARACAMTVKSECNIIVMLHFVTSL